MRPFAKLTTQSIYNSAMSRAFILYSFFLIGALMAVVTLAVPPLQKPDEEAHFIRALSIAHLQTTCSQGTLTAPRQYHTLITAIHAYELPLYAAHRIPRREYETLKQAAPDYRPYRYDTRSYCQFPVVSYLPQSVGITLGELLRLNALDVFFLGRLSAALILFAWMVGLYWMASQRIRPVLIAAYTIPMLLHQAGSYGYDGVSILLGITLFVYILTVEISSLRYSAALYILCILYLISRTAGHELICMTVPVFVMRHSHWRWRWAGAALFLAALIAPYAALKSVSVNAYINNGLPSGADPQGQLHLILTQPFRYAGMLIHTTAARAVFYGQSMIGIFGWLEYGISKWIYGFWIAIASGAVLNSRPRFSRGQALWILLVCLGSYLYIVTIFYLVWTSRDAAVADGVQGRYFLVLVPWVLALLSSAKKRVIHIPTAAKIAALIVGSGAVWSILTTILTRYYR